MDSRREFLKKASLLSGGAGLLHVLPSSIAKAMTIDPLPGSTYLDAEHIVFLMQENRSFDHTYGMLQGVRGFNDPRAITIPGNNLVWLQSNKDGETYAPFRFDIKDTKITWMNSLPHSWSNQVDARNDGKYNRWLDNKHSSEEAYATMPLTMGYYTRQDIPFYYSLADAFTVCDQHFCSSLTGTTPNRLFFWTGTIREKPDENSLAHVWNEDANYESMINWKTFPERLEENDISWKIYQNRMSESCWFSKEEDGWLGNFGDNPIEYFTQFNSKLHPDYIASLPKAAAFLAEELQKRQAELALIVPGSKDADKKNKEIDWIRKHQAMNLDDQKNYTLEKNKALSPLERILHEKALSTNRKDPRFDQLSPLTYSDGNEQREVNVPGGDVLHQFREDVEKGSLPTVSWLVAPEYFSDHPSSAWYGAWYISEVMDILTKNPEVWKKTIFILTYDENDGYFDHVPPFVAPHPYNKESGSASKDIHTGIDYVTGNSQQSIADHARDSSIGLGYRVPMVIASPWSRGGWVNSEIFDHTSSLQFLEKFLTHKTGKKIEEPNISTWRRTICGDLHSTFRRYNGEKIMNPQFVKRDEFIESIHKAKFKKPPDNYRKLTLEDIAKVNHDPRHSGLMPVQEKGIRPSSPLAYELYADLKKDAVNKSIQLNLKAGNHFFGSASAGSPFNVYAPGIFLGEETRAWAFAIVPGDALIEEWHISDFEKGNYHLTVYGPNGFFRSFLGNENDPLLDISATYESAAGSPTGNLQLRLNNESQHSLSITIRDNAYKAANRIVTLGAKGSKTAKRIMLMETAKTYGWYDCSILVKGHPGFESRYAGRVETGKASKTDPFMGGII